MLLISGHGEFETGLTIVRKKCKKIGRCKRTIKAYKEKTNEKLFSNSDWTEWSTIQGVIVSLTKFSIVIGSPRAYLSRNRLVITWVSNYRCPIWTFCNWIPLIGYPRDFHVNYARFNGFFRSVSYSFQNLWKALHTFSLKRTSQKNFLFRNLL